MLVAPQPAAAHGGDDSDSEDELMKQAFFQELEARHGGPLSCADLSKWDATLSQQDSPASSRDKAPPPLPAAGWLTPSTPHDSAIPASSALFGAPPAWCGEDEDAEDCVVTDSLTSRCCSRANDASTLPLTPPALLDLPAAAGATPPGALPPAQPEGEQASPVRAAATGLPSWHMATPQDDASSSGASFSMTSASTPTPQAERSLTHAAGGALPRTLFAPSDEADLADPDEADLADPDESVTEMAFEPAGAARLAADSEAAGALPLPAAEVPLEPGYSAHAMLEDHDADDTTTALSPTPAHLASSAATPLWLRDAENGCRADSAADGSAGTHGWIRDETDYDAQLPPYGAAPHTGAPHAGAYFTSQPEAEAALPSGLPVDLMDSALEAVPPRHAAMPAEQSVGYMPPEHAVPSAATLLLLGSPLSTSPTLPPSRLPLPPPPPPAHAREPSSRAALAALAALASPPLPAGSASPPLRGIAGPALPSATLTPKLPPSLGPPLESCYESSRMHALPPPRDTATPSPRSSSAATTPPASGGSSSGGGARSGSSGPVARRAPQCASSLSARGASRPPRAPLAASATPPSAPACASARASAARHANTSAAGPSLESPTTPLGGASATANKPARALHAEMGVLRRQMGDLREQYAKERDEWRSRESALVAELAEARRTEGYRAHILAGGRLSELPLSADELERIEEDVRAQETCVPPPPPISLPGP